MLYRCLGLVITLAVSASCGRIGYSEVTQEDGGVLPLPPLPTPTPTAKPDAAPPPPIVVLRALQGDELPAGSDIPIEVTMEPADAATPGTSVVITADRGTLVTADASGATIELLADSTGTFPAVHLHAAIDERLGARVSLRTGAERTVGDQRYTVIPPVLSQVSTSGNVYGIAGGFTVEEVPLSDADRQRLISGGSGSLAIPRPGSAFAGRGPLLAVSGMPPEIYRIERTGLRKFSTSPGIPDEGIAQVAFPDPSGPYGDVMLVCSSSEGGGDGIFTVDPQGVWSEWRSFNDCNGLLIDDEHVLGDPGYEAPLYFNIDSSGLDRASPDQDSVDKLAGNLPFGASGIRLYLNTRAPFPVGLYLLFPGSQPPDLDGFIWHTDGVSSPWETPTSFAEPLTGPRAIAFTADTTFGKLLYASMELDGELRAFHPSGQSFRIMSGLAGRVELALDRDTGILWVIEFGRGRIFQISRPQL